MIGTKTAILAAVLSAIAPMQVVMANEPGLSAQDVVRRYSKTVACQIHEESPSQYAKVQLEPGIQDDFGAIWLVGWTGDQGCMGGNGTQRVQMTTGRQKWGTLKQVTERYLWLGPWGNGPRFKRLS